MKQNILSHIPKTHDIMEVYYQNIVSKLFVISHKMPNSIIVSPVRMYSGGGGGTLHNLCDNLNNFC